MPETFLAYLPDWRSASLGAALLLLASSTYAAWRLWIRVGRLTDALNYMSQGLSMFDRATRIVVCNEQYLRMYKLSPEVVKPGCTLRQLLEHRKQTGLLTADPETYRRDIVASIKAGNTSKVDRQSE